MSQVGWSRQATFDFLTRASGLGLLPTGPSPNNVDGHSRAVNLEGVETIAHVLQQVQDEDQLAYAIDPGRHVHLFAGGQRRYELARNGT